MGARVLQNSFLGGVISPSMFGRVDDPYYAMGAYDLKNFIVLPQGAVRSRSGFQYVTKAKNSDKAVRLIPFRFASDQTLVLVFGDKTLRIVTQGKVLLNDDNEIFEIETPYKAEDLFSLNYCQNADIITITSVKYPPKELRRYGATDWRFTDVSTAPTITAPQNVTLSAFYPSDTEAKNKEKITAEYKVTSIDANGKESLPSKTYSIKCNYYITGGTVTISWSGVQGASRYRVYRSVAGIFSYLGETDGLTITDIGDNPDGSITPPIYEKPFQADRYIKSVKVVNGGSGYNPKTDYAHAFPSKLLIKYLPFGYRLRNNGEQAYYGDDATLYLDFFDGGTQIYKDNIKRDYVGNAKGDTNYYQLWLNSDYPSNVEDGFYIDVPDYIANKTYTDPKVRIRTTGVSFYLDVRKDGQDPIYDNRTIESFRSVDLDSYYKGLKDKLFKWSDSELTEWKKIYQTTYPLVDYMTLTGQLSSKPILNIKLEVIDDTGTGAVLEPIIKNGQITEVKVINGGSNYTNPKIIVTSDEGEGAELEPIIEENEVQLYPSATTQFDQRRIFAGTLSKPVHVWMTNAGQQEIMMKHRPILDDDAIDFDAVTADADRIKHAVSTNNLVLLTGSAELMVYTQNSDALTPKSIAVKALSYNGANDVQPVIANSTVVYCASRSNHALALTYAYQQGGMASFDLSLRASHLFDSNQIKDLTLSKAPLQLAWFVSSNGKLLGLTFYPDQSIQAWHVHETDGIIESCCAVSEGEEDHLYIVVKRLINGKYLRYIERLTNISIKDKEPINLDSFIQSNNSSFTSVLNLEDESKINTRGYSITGLEHLEGKTVTAIIDDNIEENLVVKNGSITVKNLGQNIAVGIPYSSSLITIPLSANTQGNLQGSVKTVSQLGVRTSYQGELFASIFPYGKEYKIKRDSNNFNNQDKQSKVSLINIPTAWDLQGQLKLTHKDVHTVEIQALIANISIEGTK